MSLTFNETFVVIIIVMHMCDGNRLPHQLQPHGSSLLDCVKADVPDCCDPSPDTKEARQVSGYLRKPGVVCGVMVAALLFQGNART